MIWKPDNSAFDEGLDAYCLRIPRNACPHAPGTPEHHDWLRGWDEAEAIDREDGISEEEINVEIWVELIKVMRQLGADPDRAVQALWRRDQLYQTLEHLGAKSDLLGIVWRYGDTQSDEWVLEQLRRWNAGQR